MRTQKNILRLTIRNLISAVLDELKAFGMVQKKQYEGYPLRVGYSLTEKGTRMLNVVVAMQEIGIELMKEDGKEDFLREKGLI